MSSRLGSLSILRPFCVHNLLRFLSSLFFSFLTVAHREKGLVHIPNWKRASPYPQRERGHHSTKTGTLGVSPPAMHTKLKKSRHGTNSLWKGAKTSVRLFAGIQNFAQRARHSHRRHGLETMYSIYSGATGFTHRARLWPAELEAGREVANEFRQSSWPQFEPLSNAHLQQPCCAAQAQHQHLQSNDLHKCAPSTQSQQLRCEQSAGALFFLPV